MEIKRNEEDTVAKTLNQMREEQSWMRKRQKVMHDEQESIKNMLNELRDEHKMEQESVKKTLNELLELVKSSKNVSKSDK